MGKTKGRLLGKQSTLSSSFSSNSNSPSYMLMPHWRPTSLLYPTQPLLPICLPGKKNPTTSCLWLHSHSVSHKKLKILLGCAAHFMLSPVPHRLPCSTGQMKCLGFNSPKESGSDYKFRIQSSSFCRIPHSTWCFLVSPWILQKAVEMVPLLLYCSTTLLLFYFLSSRYGDILFPSVSAKILVFTYF